MLTSIITELSGTKMGECNEIWHIKATISFLKELRRVYDLSILQLMHSFMSCHTSHIINFEKLD